MASRPFIDVMFGAFEPDQGGMPNASQPGYLTDAVNVRATTNGYRGLPTFSSFSNTVGSAGPIGTAAAIFGVSALDFFAITDVFSHLYQSSDLGSSWANVTPVSAAVTPLSQIIPFDDRVILVDQNDISVKDMTASTATVFSALGGSPPNARVGARIREHLVLGALVGASEYRVQWSAIGDPADWPTPGTSDALAKEAGEQDLPQAMGKIRALLGGEKFGIVAQEFGLTRMTYVGGSVVYEFDGYEKKYGAGAISTALGAGYTPFVQIGPSQWVWMNEQGVFTTDGYSVRNLSEGRIEVALFLNRLSHPSATMTVGIRGAYDPRRKMVIFKTNASSGQDQHLLYHLSTDRFTIAKSTDYHVLFEGPTSDTNLARVVYSMNTNRSVYSLNGNAGSTVALQTGYIEIDPGYRVQLTGAHLLGTGTSGLTLSYKASESIEACDLSQSGFTDLTAATRGQRKTGRASGQCFAFRVTGTMDESMLARGVRIYFERGDPA